MEYSIQELKPYIFGLPWFGKEDYKLQRFPTSSLPHLPNPIQELATNPAGGMLRFRTRTELIAFETFRPETHHFDRFSAYFQYGLDIYRDGKWFACLICNKGIQNQWITTDPDTEHEYSIYFPPYNTIELRTLILEGDEVHFPPAQYPEGPTLSPAAPFKTTGKIVIYGSSITQGANASRGGLTYPARIGRILDGEVVNMGFSGAGKGEHEVSDLLAAIPDVCCYIMDWGCNIAEAAEASTITERYPYLVDKIRANHPNVPIIYVNTQIFQREFSKPEIQNAFAFVRQTIQANFERDRNAQHPCAFVEGRDIIGPEDFDCTVDGVHCNDWGFTRYVDALVPIIREVLKQK
jgi:hypothetical protein